jgi:CRISPR/Cas system-associated exonuclease Cas4 (RecB family)
MTTIEHKNSVYAYYFYRLIQRAENITLMYNTASDGMNSGEWSRFMLQFLLEWPHDIRREFLEAGQSPKSERNIVVEKSDSIVESMRRKYDFGVNSDARALSPSALNCYMNCPLSFYFRYVAGLKAPDEVSADIDSALFGTIFHRSAELVYDELREHGTEIREEDLQRLLDDERKLQDYVDRAFKEEFFMVPLTERPEYNGVQLINSKVICSYLKQLLRNDMHYAPFSMVATEKQVSEEMKLSMPDGEWRIAIGGTIDRMDLKDGTLRIVDYKTGGTPLVAPNMESLFTPSDKRPGYVFQTFLYAAIMTRQQQYIVAPSLLYIHKAAGDDYSPVIQMGERSSKAPVNNFSLLEDDFRERLVALLKEIFSKERPFAQTELTDKCSFCDFRALCQR